MSTAGMFNVVYISSLNIIVGHPNGTLATISNVGNLKLTNNMVLYDVLVVPDYYVSLMSVNKLIKDIKMFIGFDENKCYIQDLKKEKILRTGSESAGLYLFDMVNDNSVGKSNVVMLPSSVLKDVKFYETVFPFKMKSKSAIESVDVDYASDTNHLTFFDSQSSQSPYDDGRDTSVEDGSESSLDHDETDTTSSSLCQEHNTATHFGDQSSSEGNHSQKYPGQTLNFNNNDFEDGQTPGIRKSSSQTKLPLKLNDYVLNSIYGIEKFVSYSCFKCSNLCFSSTLNKSVEPTCLFEALSAPNWVDAMNNEIESLNRNNTWTECDLPPGRKPIGIKMVTVRCLVSIAMVHGWPMYQLDINNAFLYRDLTEDVYMTLSEGYKSGNKTKVCKLNKSLYGLKQSPRHCNAKLITALVEHGFEQSKFDYDIIITGNDEAEINSFKKFLSSKFLIKDLGELKYFLRIDVLENDKGLCIT
ncbi:ribonuclease H-like domain-containing protein [Tanacetum coccineum]